MKVLAADTSTKVISVALLDKNQLKAEIHQPYSRSQGSALIPIIKKLLTKAGYDITQIELFCVGLGPGSFTGLRVSVAAMRSLSIALKKPIVGIPSFDAIASNCAGQDKGCLPAGRQICVLFDARQNKFYARFYQGKQNFIEPVTDFLLDSLENILHIIKDSTTIAGDAVGHYGKKISELTNGKVTFAPENLWYPKADILARMAQDKYKKGHRDDPFKLLPLYIYPKECQIKIKNQISKIKNQKSKIKYQKLGLNNQKSKIKYQKLGLNNQKSNIKNEKLQTNMG